MEVICCFSCLQWYMTCCDIPTHSMENTESYHCVVSLVQGDIWWANIELGGTESCRCVVPAVHGVTWLALLYLHIAAGGSKRYCCFILAVHSDTWHLFSHAVGLHALQIKTKNNGLYTQTCQPNSFIPAKHHWTLPVHTTCRGIDFGWGSQDQWKAKPFGFMFLYTSQLISMKFDVVLKRFKLNILGYFFERDEWKELLL